jgi:hypothetical protein
VQAEVIAVQCRRHLHTAVAGDAVEVVLVALIAAPQAAVEPEAGLDSARAYEVVALAGEGLL